MKRTIGLAPILLLIATSATAADQSLLGKYAYHFGPIATDASCVDHVANLDPVTAETITITAREILSNADGYGPVMLGKTVKGTTSFTLESVGADETVVKKGRAIQKGRRILILQYEDGDRADFCRM